MNIAKHDVFVIGKALSDINACVEFVTRVSKEASIKLYNQIYDAIDSLEQLPERNPVFEVIKGSTKFRQFLVGERYLIIYLIEDNKVIVHNVIDKRKGFQHI
jgi:plasmid stabilization system protein ParE